MSYRSTGNIMVEFSFGVFSVLFVLIIMLGVINGSLDRIITNSNFKNIAGTSASRTDYQGLGREIQNLKVYVK